MRAGIVTPAPRQLTFGGISPIALTLDEDL